MVGFGVRTNGVEVPGGVVLWVVDGSVAVAGGPVSIAEASCADGAFEAASSSESSELKPVRGISEMDRDWSRGSGGYTRKTSCWCVPFWVVKRRS